MEERLKSQWIEGLLPGQSKEWETLGVEKCESTTELFILIAESLHFDLTNFPVQIILLGGILTIVAKDG